MIGDDKSDGYAGVKQEVRLLPPVGISKGADALVMAGHTRGRNYQTSRARDTHPARRCTRLFAVGFATPDELQLRARA